MVKPSASTPGGSALQPDFDIIFQMRKTFFCKMSVLIQPNLSVPTKISEIVEILQKNVLRI
jgi:hypothetical protein